MARPVHRGRDPPWCGGLGGEMLGRVFRAGVARHPAYD